MELWTWQTPDFSLLEGEVKWERSRDFLDEKGIPEAYKKLASILGTDQIIWCYTVHTQRNGDRVEWILDVPEEKVLKFVDDIVWNRILGIKCGLTTELRLRFRHEALDRFPGEVDARHECERQLKEVFLDRLQDGDWRNSLFVEPQAKEGITALIEHTVEHDWVVTNPLKPQQSYDSVSIKV